MVGGGYAGTSAALHLAERGLSVVLLEANRIGWGASGRNGGQLGVGPRADIRTYEALVGREDARKIREIATAANRLVRDLIARHRIDCDLANGYLEAAWRRPESGRHGRLCSAYGGRLRPHGAGSSWTVPALPR